MARDPKPITEQGETRRLNRVYKHLPANKKAVAQGLIIEAARLRVLLDRLWADIEENGMTESFSQSPEAEPYDRERPAARQYYQADKAYQTIIKMLDAMVPVDAPGSKDSKLGKILRGLDDDNE